MRRLSTTLARIALTAMAPALLASCITRFAPDPSARAPLLDGFGSLQIQVTTRSADAQDLFTRGMLQAYAFNQEEAVRTFKAALAADPGCALCAWGVAYALGPNINDIERGDLDEARRYVAWAQRHAETATPRERGLIEALSARYGSGGKQAPPAAKEAASAAPTCGNAGPKADPLDIVYAIRMRALLVAYPDDPDILSLYAEALMIETRIDWWDRSSGAAAPGFAELVDRLEQALRSAPDHTGLNHYLIHAADSSPAPQRAVAASDRLGALAPESPHLLHMPSHIYVHVGRFADAVRVNEEALAAEQRQVQKFVAQGFRRSVNWNSHNTHFLWYSALMEGRGDLALGQARRMAEGAAKGKKVSAEFVRGLPLLTLVRLERWQAAAEEPVPAGAQGVAAAIGHFGHGMAAAQRGQRMEAAAAATALRAAVADPQLADKTIYGDPVAKVLGVLAAELDAALADPASATDAARAAMQAGIDQEQALEANEPPLLGAGARLALGDLLLRRKQWPEAEAVFRAELAAQPGSGWALRGLAAALQAQAKPKAARLVEAELGLAWTVADAGLRERRLP